MPRNWEFGVPTLFLYWRLERKYGGRWSHASCPANSKQLNATICRPFGSQITQIYFTSHCSMRNHTNLNISPSGQRHKASLSSLAANLLVSYSGRQTLERRRSTLYKWLMDVLQLSWLFMSVVFPAPLFHLAYHDICRLCGYLSILSYTQVLVSLKMAVWEREGPNNKNFGNQNRL